MSIRRAAALCSSLVVMLATVGGATDAYAASGYVTAESRYGNGSITAPVREARNGYQVRLPRGNWVYCRRSCAETLRVETVDLLEISGSLPGYGTRLNECGIFGCLELRSPR